MSDVDTLRDFLDSVDFDWDTGRILYQPTSGYSPGWSSGDEVGAGRIIAHDDPVIDLEFDGSYGAPQCPRFVAEDKDALYFPSQYDGATCAEKVFKDIARYETEPTPYPGG